MVSGSRSILVDLNQNTRDTEVLKIPLFHTVIKISRETRYLSVKTNVLYLLPFRT